MNGFATKGATERLHDPSHGNWSPWKQQLRAGPRLRQASINNRHHSEHVLCARNYAKLSTWILSLKRIS